MESENLQETGHKLMRVVMFTLILSVMSAMMFNFVLPEIRDAFDLSVAQVSWVTSSYVLIYGIGTIIYGKLADRYKLKDLLTLGLILFAAGSLFGLASQTFWMVLAARCLQAMGAACIPATAMIIPVRYFAPERRGSATGTAFVGLALGSALGPVISALLVSVANWRWLFCIPLMILITLPFYRKYLHEEQQKVFGKFDWIGGALLAAAVTLLLLGVTNGTWLFPALGLLALALLVIRIRTASDPFIQTVLFVNRSYSVGIVLTFLISAIGFSLYFLSPLLLAQVYELPPGWIGLAMVPAAIVSAVLGRKAGKLADRKGNSYLFFIASGLLFVCFVLLSIFTGNSPIFIAIFLIFGNVGQTFMMISLSNSVSITLQKHQAGVGMGLFSMLNFIAGGMASGIYGKVVDIGSRIHWIPVNMNDKSIIYSNIFLVLAVMHAVILVFYYLQNSSINRKSSTGRLKSDVI